MKSLPSCDPNSLLLFVHSHQKEHWKFHQYRDDNLAIHAGNDFCFASNFLIHNQFRIFPMGARKFFEASNFPRQSWQALC